jgi:6-phosphogluconate dehydrogenase
LTIRQCSSSRASEQSPAHQSSGHASLDLTAAALVEDPALSTFAGRVSDSGEGRWTINAAIDEGVRVPVLSAALYQRFNSRGEADYQDKLLSAMRYQFGGHVEMPRGKQAA